MLLAAAAKPKLENGEVEEGVAEGDGAGGGALTGVAASAFDRRAITSSLPKNSRMSPRALW